jgi:peroxiredoxin
MGFLYVIVLNEHHPTQGYALIRLLLIALYICSTPTPSVATTRIGQTLSDYALTGLDGRAMRLGDYSAPSARLLIFFSIDCPTSRIYADHLNRIHTEFGPRGITLIGVNANFNESADSITAFAVAQQFEFPILRDVNNRLADELDAQSTPHAFLFDASGVLLYRGEIDNGFGREAETTSRGLWDAMDALFAGQPVPQPETRSLGCIIRRIHEPPTEFSPDAPTYTRDIAPFLQKNCQPCHHNGGIGRVAYDSYDIVAAWAPDMRDSIRAGDMPPWPPKNDINDFDDARTLTEREIQTFYTWIDEGMPVGREEDKPEPIEFKDGWTFGDPDIILVPEEPYVVEAVGEDEYRCFVLPIDREEGAWVRGIEILPSAREVVHHVSVYLDESGKAFELQKADPKPGYASFGGIGFATSGSLGGWAPGNSALLLPEGIGRRLPAKGHIVIQVHYHKSGREVLDRSQLGIYLQKEPVKQELVEEAVASRLLFIPPGARQHRAEGGITIGQDSHVLAILPHMHLLGTEIKITATFPDGETRPLVWVDDWEFNWQETYVYKEPIKLPRGTRISLEAFYDNSADNPKNPNRPPKFVRWGEGSSDEMCIAFLFVTRDNENLLEP